MNKKQTFYQKYVKKIFCSFRYRIILLFSSATIIPLIVLGLFSFSILSDYMIENIENEMEQFSAQLNTEANNSLSQAVALMNLSNSNGVAHFLTVDDGDNTYQAALELGQSYFTMRSMKQIPDFVTDITIIGISGNGYSEHNGYFQLENNFLEYPEISQIVGIPKSIHVFRHPLFFHEMSWEKESFSMARGVFRAGTTELIGIVQISLDRTYLSDLFQRHRLNDHLQIFMVSPDGELIYPFYETQNYWEYKDVAGEIFQQSNTRGMLTVEINGEKRLFFYEVLPSTNWFTISTIGYQELLKPAYSILTWTIFTFAFIIILMIVMNILISSNIVRPIEKLSGLMQRAANKDLQIAVPTSNITEISSLYNSFDTMTQNIRQLMEDVIEEQNEKKKMELTILQEQINPHFLYNSLEAIIWAASNGKSAQVEELTVSLAHFYRLALSKGMDIVTLRQELELVSCYLTIMKMQYNDLFDYRITTDETVSNILFPKMVLQPIVENSIYHGLQMKQISFEQPGFIEILVRRTSAEASSLTIEIRDNGAGIAQENLTELNQCMNISCNHSPVGFGLKNINHRIKLYYGERYGLKIESVLHMGTTVKITVPLIVQRDDVKSERKEIK